VIIYLFKVLSIYSIDVRRDFVPKENPPHFAVWGIYIKGFGSDLLSHPVTQAVPSAQRSLTSVFGMGTGVSSPLLPPKIRRQRTEDRGQI
jgi:hypothetical protein